MSVKPKLAALAAGISILMACNETQLETGFIGPSQIEVQDGVMTPEVLLSLGRLSDPQLSPDGQYILYGVSYTDIAQNRSCRNLYLCKADGSDNQMISFAGKSLSNARWLDGGSRIAYIREGQIWTAELKIGPDGNASLSKGEKISDVKRGVSEFKLSPDGKQVLYSSTVPSDVKTASDSDPALDKAQAYVTEDLMYRHWDHWVTELPHSYIAPFGEGINEENSTDLLGGEKFELPAEPFGGLEQLSWSPDGQFIAYSCKKLSGKQYAFSTNSDIYIYSLTDGKTTRIQCDNGYDTDPVWSPDGQTLAWISMERDGYEADKTRLMTARFDRASAEASDIRDVTAGFKYNAAAPVWSADSKYIYFNALAEGIQRIYRAGEDIVPMTGENLWYDFSSPFAILGDGTLLTSYCSMDFPTEMVAVKTPTELERISHENDRIISQLTPHDTEAVQVKTVDGNDMLTWILYPPQFDQSKSYPAIEIFLGGPQGTLSQGWSYRWNYRLMAAQGYVVVLPNRRGTTAFGQEWTEQISGDYSGLNIQDYLSAAKYIKSKPYIGKLAGCGASYGGYSVYYLAGVHENTFDCFIAHAGIFDERYMYYETEEMWFPNWDNGGLSEYAYEAGQTGPKGDGITFGGLQQAGSPWSDAPKAKRHYANSPAMNVSKWNTPILCIHGGMDFRIPYDQGMAAFNCAQMMGVPSKLIVFPDECHWILQPQNALFWHRSYFDWLDRWCK